MCEKLNETCLLILHIAVLGIGNFWTNIRWVRNLKRRICWYCICRAWQSFLVVLVFYTAWVCPFEFGFLMGPEGPLAITDTVVNGFFLIDIVVSFFVAYLDKSTYLLVDEPKSIALRYARRGLVFDVISSVPYEFLQKLLPQDAHAYGYLTMLRLWRIRRVSAMFER